MPKKNKKLVKSAQSSRFTHLKTHLVLAAMIIILGGSAGLLVHDIQTIGCTHPSSAPSAGKLELAKQYNKLRIQIGQLIAKSKTVDPTIIDVDQTNRNLDRINIELVTNNLIEAKANLQSVDTELIDYEAQLNDTILAQTRPTPVPITTSMSASSTRHYTPIIMYHHTPVDFERQLQIIRDRGYTTLTMSELHNGLADPSRLPAKSVAITFDDGYSDQLDAFALLQKYNMKATFFIITSGQASDWCIGMNRHHDQPQPCGNDFMSATDIKMLDRSGTIEIGNHTADHLRLDGLGPEAQAYQIISAKQALEQLLGHDIYSFAYPYGSFNQSTIDQVMSSGLTNAVTTIVDTDHNAGDLFTLSRIVDADKLH